jgi:hypothetical protein
MESAEAFVIRIYRRGVTEANKLRGVLESVHDGGIRSFSNFNELCALLKESLAKTADHRRRTGKKS